MTTSNTSSEIQITRLYDAPVAAVWDAWTDPAQAAKWWGPRGFTITTHSKELKPGGHWHYTMHGPDGVDYPNKTKYFEVEKHAKLVYDHGGNDEQAPLFRVTVLFQETDGKTKMDMTMRFASPEIAQNSRKFIKEAGGNSTWDRLAEYLEDTLAHKDIFIINRSFEAPIQTVFKMWTDPAHLSQWVPPKGFAMEFIRNDIREGGSTFSKMFSPDHSVTMYGRAEYLEIKNPTRVVYTQQFCDENEKVTRHPMSPTWPETMLTTILLSEEGLNQTRVTIRWEIFGKSTAEERATFSSAKAGMTQGWTGSLDKLEDYLDSGRK